MSPETPRFPSSEGNKDHRKEKRRKKSANLRVPGIVSVENESKDKSVAKPESIPLSQAFDSLMKHKDEAVADNVIKKEVQPSSDNFEKTKTEPAESTVIEKPEITPEHTDEPDETEGYEKLPNYEPEPVEFSGGEVIIHLQGDQPIAERVIPLQAENEPEVEQPKEPVFEVPTLTPQLEQQQYAQAELPEPAAAGGGEVPPTQPPEALPVPFEEPPEPPHQPTEILQPPPEDVYQPFTTMPNTTPTPSGAERVATKQDVEDAVHYATKAGQNRGVLTGLLVGGGYEHFKHKRREKRQAKRFKQQSKQLEEARQNYTFGLQEQARSDQRIESMERRFNTPEKRFENPAPPEKLPQNAVEQPKSDIEAQLHIPDGHRLETSAWHSIEIDSKTGKPVENPAFQYGREYYRERAQESAPAQQRDATTGEVALAATAGVRAPSSSGSLPSAQIPDASTQGPPLVPTSQATQSSQNTPTEPAVSTGPLWPWLVALAVVTICLIALLH